MYMLTLHVLVYCEHAFQFSFCECFFRLYKLWYGRKRKEQLQTDLPEEVRMTCTKFTKYHKDQCFHDIVKKRR